MTITTKIIKDSISEQGIRIVTLELEYPRFIHSEFMTHRVFSRNAASSRAIPCDKMHQSIIDNMAMPVHWGLNKPGMQASEEVGEITKTLAKADWVAAAKSAIDWSKRLMNHGIHKQIANRVTEPFTTIKVVVTSTEWDNFFDLRAEQGAQPEFQELAYKMRDAMQESIPQMLKYGEWHLPYVSEVRANGKVQVFIDSKGYTLTLDEAKMLSASSCAQVSYRSTNDSLEKAMEIYKRLIESKPAHSSPIEHQATPMHIASNWDYGITHMDRYNNFWSNNFKGWIQLRALDPSSATNT